MLFRDRMRLSRLSTLLVLLSALSVAPVPLAATESKILKVLPHLLDLQGRHSLSPSLYERDAYQAILRKHPDRISALRFDIHWRADRAAGSHPVLRMELRTSKHQGNDVVILESPLPARGTRGWTPLTLDAAGYRDVGDIQAWRATIRNGDQVLAESKSFLW